MGARTDTRFNVNGALRKVQEFYQGGVPFCEWCKRTVAVHNAHSRKGFDPESGERWLPDDPEHENFWLWFDVAWLCDPCHDKVEVMGHDRMFEAVHKIMRPRTGMQMYTLARNRGWWPPKEQKR